VIARPSKIAVAVLPPRDWTNILFIGFAHLTALAALAWICAVRTSLPTIGLGAAWFALCSLSISGGYHRLFAHPTYRANGFIRAFYLISSGIGPELGAQVGRGPPRPPHEDRLRRRPYDIRRGLWWAHMGWILRREVRPAALHRVKDLIADRSCAGRTGTTA
jgi:stearoyl-CoA desaturase (delta-9 desaturase)